MKISNSKKELARIISENGGWRDGAEFAAQDQNAAVTFFVDTPWRCGAAWEASGFEAVDGFGVTAKALTNWRQTILSRAEYLHLYPAPDADGWIEWKDGEGPVGEGVLIDAKKADGSTELAIHDPEDRIWGDTEHLKCIIAYRLHKQEQAEPEFCESVMLSIPGLGINSKNIDINQVNDINVVESKPAIEQLAADYRSAKDYACRKQQEADAAKADADEKLRVLEIAGEALGLLVSPITEKQEPGLVIAVQVGDEVECIKSNVNPGKCMGGIGTVSSVDVDDTSTPYLVDFGGKAKIWCHEVKFIRRP